MRRTGPFILCSILAAVGVFAQGADSSAPAATRAIRGQVIDGRGRPIPDAKVVIGHELDGTIYYGGGRTLTAAARQAKEMPGAKPSPGETIGTATTPDDGRFSFGDLAEGRFTLVAVHPEHGIAIHADAPSSNLDPVDIRLTEPAFLAARISSDSLDLGFGYIDLQSECRVANVQLSLRMEATGESKPREWTTGPIPEGGTWTLIGQGRNRARAYSVALLRMPVEIKPGRRNQIEIDFGQGHAIRGTVLGPDARPLEDVAIVARAVDAPAEARGAFSGPDGGFQILGLRPGEYELEAIRHGLRTEIGCGDGPIDVRRSDRIRIPQADRTPIEVRIASLVPKLAVGDAAPDFNGQAIDGTTLRLADLRGRVVLLDFWATWCGLCLSDLKHIARLHDELSEKGLVVVSISLDQDPRAVERFLQRQKLPWPQLVLGPAASNPIARLYNVMSTPTTMLIDRHGRIAARNIAGQDLRAEAMKLLE